MYLFLLSERLEATAQWFLLQALSRTGAPGYSRQDTEEPPSLQGWVEKETDTNGNPQNNIFSVTWFLSIGHYTHHLYPLFMPFNFCCF